MKKIKHLIISVIFLFSGISILFAQNTEGKEFWLTFGPIGSPGNCIVYSLPNVYLKIRIVGGNQPTTGTINFH